MAIITYPLNNIEYTAEDAELFHATRTSGVFANDDFPITVSGSGNVVTIGEGLGWIRNSKFSGKVVANKAEMSLDLGLPHATYPRIDAVVLRFSANDNASEIIVKNGTAQTIPAPPEVVQTKSIYELHLYHVYRPEGASNVVASNVTDLRANPAYCGLMEDDVTMINDAYVNKDVIGKANGIASLDSNGFVPSSQLPLSSSVSSTSASTAATSNAVKAAYDLANTASTAAAAAQSTADAAMPKAGGTFQGDISGATVSAGSWSFKNISVNTSVGGNTGTNVQRIIMLRK